jgi:hypothetical protein
LNGKKEVVTAKILHHQTTSPSSSRMRLGWNAWPQVLSLIAK